MTICHRNLIVTVTTMLIFLLPLPLPQAAAVETKSAAGLYVGKDFAGGGPYKVLGHHFNEQYLYLAPDGTFYEGYGSSGYDRLEKTDEVKTGRYSVQSDKVTLRYADGSEVVIGRGANSLNYGDVGVARRQPICDGLKLNGTYQPAGLATGIVFTPDGRFVDHGIVGALTETKLVGLRMYKDEPRPGPGTYSIKNHTLALQYANGHVTRLFFYINPDERGEMDFGTIHVNRTVLVRQGGSFSATTSIPAARLPRIEAPLGWKSQYDSTHTRTNIVPPNLPNGRTVLVTVLDPKPLNQNNTQFPDRFHDAFVQELAKGYSSEGMRTEKAMTRQDVRKVPSSTGVFVLPDGKQWWITVFTVVSASEGQAILLISNSEDLHKTYLPTVQAMLGDGDISAPAPTASPSTSSAGPLKVTLPPGWKAEYNPTDKITTFLPPEIPSGRVVLVQMADPGRTTSSSSRFHDEAVQEITESLKDGRLEGHITREDSQTVASSTGVFVNQHAKRVWVTVLTSVSGDIGQGGVLLTDGEDLHKRYVSTVMTMFAEAANQ